MPVLKLLGVVEFEAVQSLRTIAKGKVSALVVHDDWW